MARITANEALWSEDTACNEDFKASCAGADVTSVLSCFFKRPVANRLAEAKSQLMHSLYLQAIIFKAISIKLQLLLLLHLVLCLHSFHADVNIPCQNILGQARVVL